MLQFPSQLIFSWARDCVEPFDHTKEQHNKKRSMPILIGKRLVSRVGKRGLLVAPKEHLVAF
jgi:hypothetical protein